MRPVARVAPAVVIVLAALAVAVAASGAFGDEPTPPLDTGLVPEQRPSRISEARVARVVVELRADAAAAARERTADRSRAPAPVSR